MDLCFVFVDRHNFKHGNRQGIDEHEAGRGLFVGVLLLFYSLTDRECECNYVTLLQWGEDEHGVWREMWSPRPTRVIFKRGSCFRGVIVFAYVHSRRR